MQLIEKIFPELAGQTWQVVAVYLGVLVAVYLLIAIAEWKMYTKMGEKGWKAFIPVYNVYVLLRRCSKTKYLWQVVLWSVLAFVCEIIAYVLGTESDWVVFPIVAEIAVLIVLVVIEVRVNLDVSRSFGHGGGFTVGLLLLPVVFELILGLGGSKYVGNAAEKRAKKSAD
ncbi:MAG: DUF5684 domain-containing protein [Candidatus Scatosoma sp.]